MTQNAKIPRIIQLAEAGKSVRRIVKRTGADPERVAKINAALSESLKDMSKPERKELKRTAKKQLRKSRTRKPRKA